jgi:hypothetical protein
MDLGQFRLPIKNMAGESYERFVEDVKALNMQDLFSVL